MPEKPMAESPETEMIGLSGCTSAAAPLNSWGSNQARWRLD
jgi:hypothetical protein